MTDEEMEKAFAVSHDLLVTLTGLNATPDIETVAVAKVLATVIVGVCDGDQDAAEATLRVLTAGMKRDIKVLCRDGTFGGMQWPQTVSNRQH